MSHDRLLTLLHSSLVEFFDMKDLARLRRASRLFWPFFNHVQRVTIRDGIFNLHYSWVASLPSLQRIHLHNVYFNDDDLFTLRHCRLTELLLHCADLSIAGPTNWESHYGLLAIAENTPHMKSFTLLNVAYSLAKNIGAMLLRHWRQLSSLTIQCGGIDAPFITELSFCQHLTHLSLMIHCCTDNFDDSVDLNRAVQAYIGSSHDLIDLELTSFVYNDYTDETIFDEFDYAKFEYDAYSWGSYPSLTRLTVNENFRITDATLEQLVKMTPLLQEFRYGSSAEFTSFEHFAVWTRLERIHVEPLAHDWHASGIDAVFKHCNHLSTICVDSHIYRMDIPDLVAAHCANLTSFDYSYHTITCLDALLTQCPKLKHLYINADNLSEPNFVILKKMNLLDLFIKCDRTNGPTSVSTDSFSVFIRGFGARLHLDAKTHLLFHLT